MSDAMGFVGGFVGYRTLRLFCPPRTASSEIANADKHKSLDLRFGPDIWQEIEGKTVIDFGCGLGEDAIEMARYAQRVIGVEAQRAAVESAQARARVTGLDNVYFCLRTHEKADVIVSINSFEHFADPAGVLETMASLLEPTGRVLISFGPTWYHPHGGHLFSVFPWAHLVFTENVLLRWRGEFRNDGATRFGEVAGGLNQMTVRRFRRLVEVSPLRFVTFETVPIRATRWAHNGLTKEFLTSFVRCRLALR